MRVRFGHMRVLRLAVVVLSLMMAAGCEDDDPDVGEVDRYMSEEGHESGNRSAPVAGETEPLTASVSPTKLENDGDKAIGIASGGVPPYTWTVLDAALGHIVGSDTGASIAYMRDHEGQNVLRVRDKKGTVINIVIEQP